MKTNESKSQKPFAGWLRCGDTVWKFLQRSLRRRPLVNEERPAAVPDEQPETPVNPLDHIQAHLRHHGLGQRVHVRCEATGSGFVLEDADGYVHAADYAAAVAVIERIWLYQP